ncbi:MAG TPA: sigma-54 dependent transcriptional regulator [Thermoanaerobaculia bacterium]|nr:sigma-54 dependent transcriptional regulator [Thermoanaerobaculia bacterium]
MSRGDAVPRVLVVDDEESMLEFLELLLRDEGYEVATARSATAARERLSDDWDMVLCDIMMPDGNGLDLLREIQTGDGDQKPAVIMMTAYTSTRSAIEAMKAGAFDYVSKPFDVEELKVVCQRALEQAELKDENVYLRRELEQRYTFGNIIGKSPKMQAVFTLVDRVARTSSTVLIHGESGTGKELVARAIHFASPRSSERFLSINCGAMPENLLESELFGHVRGAFTGAVKEKRGLFQEAHGGTLFLDEIGDMTTPMQVKLLRTLQEKVVRKVGGTGEETVDARIIAATNRDLEAMVEEGAFREDLFYRINVIPVHLPPLRDRREDVPLLVDFFLDKYSAEMGIEAKGMSVDAMRRLEAYDWPGNVRELENVVERALALSTDEVLREDDLPEQVRRGRRGEPGDVELPTDGLDLEEYLETVRASLMRQALERSDGVQTRAAEILGMTFRSFRYYARKVGLTGDDEGDDESPEA